MRATTCLCGSNHNIEYEQNLRYDALRDVALYLGYEEAEAYNDDCRSYPESVKARIDALQYTNPNQEGMMSKVMKVWHNEKNGDFVHDACFEEGESRNGFTVADLNLVADDTECASCSGPIFATPDDDDDDDAGEEDDN